MMRLIYIPRVIQTQTQSLEVNELIKELKNLQVDPRVYSNNKKGFCESYESHNQIL